MNSTAYSDPIISDAHRAKSVTAFLYSYCFIKKTGTNLAAKCLIKILEILRNVVFQKNAMFIYVLLNIVFGHFLRLILSFTRCLSLAHNFDGDVYLELRYHYLF
mmetsp:Transcript_11343/g.28671  ORF Transcript_11343/g.28671 Transcript_11343/m.28671 type:complete len:104 (-) Transcript_11343:50-361(-)